jgi:exopolysaccharide biosynthesis polyprenyl glycosylphosphotransferase
MSSPARFLTAVDASQFIATDSNRWSSYVLATFEKLLDLSTVVTAVFVADAAYSRIAPDGTAPYATSTMWICASTFALLFVFLFDRHGGYRPCVSLLAIRETERILRVTLQAFAIALIAAYFFRVTPSRLALGLVAALVPLFVTFEKWETHQLLQRLRSKGYGTRRALILGTDGAARRIYTALVRSPKFGVEPVAFIQESAADAPEEIFECAYHREHSAHVFTGPLRPETFRHLNASVLVITNSLQDREAMRRALTTAVDAGVTTYVAPGDLLESGYWLNYSELDGIMLAEVSRGATRVVYECAKRILDIAGASLLTLILAPIAVLIASMVKFSSPGPIFFRQERVGKQGRLFPMYKFRSMYVEAPKYGYSPTDGEDPRVTPVGRFLRRASLDEIPQLINVLLGQMSLVGPRPEMPFIVEQYTPLQQQRLMVKPGITGLWQISADRAFLIHENMEYDVYYFRLNIFYLLVPPLRERIEDILPLSQEILRAIARTYNRSELRISDSAMAELERYPWPGNIRELRNVLERASMSAEHGVVAPEHLNFHATSKRDVAPGEVLNGTLRDVERAYINLVLRDEGGSIERAARRLGIPRSSLYNKMRRFEIPQGTGRFASR